MSILGERLHWPKPRRNADKGHPDPASEAGEVRSDIHAEDILRALIGMCYMHDQPGWQPAVIRLVDVFVDGLRVQGGAAKQAEQQPQGKAAKTKRR